MEKKRKKIDLIMNNDDQSFRLVMLVGNNQEANYINRKVLEISKFSVDIVSKTSGSSAIEYLRNHITHPSLLPELILLDISKPVIRGYEFLHTFEQDAKIRKSNIKIIVVSNSLNTEEIDAILKRSPVVGYVTKPLLVEKLNTLKSSYLKAPNKKQRIN